MVLKSTHSRRRRSVFTSDPILDILQNIDCLFPKSPPPMTQNQNQPQQPRAFGRDPYGPLNFFACVG